MRRSMLLLRMDHRCKVGYRISLNRLGSLGFDRQLQRTAPFKLLVIFRAKNDAYESATFGVDAFFSLP